MDSANGQGLLLSRREFGLGFRRLLRLDRCGPFDEEPLIRGRIGRLDRTLRPQVADRLVHPGGRAHAATGAGIRGHAHILEAGGVSWAADVPQAAHPVLWRVRHVVAGLKLLDELLLRPL